jgi:hypothetical protein
MRREEKGACRVWCRGWCCGLKKRSSVVCSLGPWVESSLAMFGRRQCPAFPIAARQESRRCGNPADEWYCLLIAKHPANFEGAINTFITTSSRIPPSLHSFDLHCLFSPLRAFHPRRATCAQARGTSYNLGTHVSSGSGLAFERAMNGQCREQGSEETSRRKTF